MMYAKAQICIECTDKVTNEILVHVINYLSFPTVIIVARNYIPRKVFKKISIHFKKRNSNLNFQKEIMQRSLIMHKLPVA